MNPNLNIRPKDKTLKAKLAKLAKADKRTLNNYVEIVLQNHVEGSNGLLETLHPKRQK